MAKASKTANTANTAKTAKTARIDQLAQFEMVDISKISYDLKTNRQSGLDDQSISEFADTLKHDGGVHTPVLLERKGENLRMVAGHRRLLASKKAGFTKIPAMVYSEISDVASFNMQVGENLSRVDMSPIDKAIYMMVAKDKLKIKLEDVSAIFFKGKRDRGGDVSNFIKLLDLTEENQKAVHRGEMTITQAYDLLKKGVSPEAQKIMGEIASVVHKNPNTTKRTKQEQNKKAMEALATQRPDLGLRNKKDKTTPNPLAGGLPGSEGKEKKPTDISAPETPEKRDSRMSDPQWIGYLNRIIAACGIKGYEVGILFKMLREHAQNPESKDFESLLTVCGQFKSVDNSKK